MRRLALLAAVVCAQSLLHAAPPTVAPFLVKSWTVEDRLPGSGVSAVIRSHDGYLWCGTDRGLVRFDGKEFTLFNEANVPGLGSSPFVLYLFEDSHSNLWVGTEDDGVMRIHDGQVEHLGLGQGSRDGRLVAAAEDSTGAVWLQTASGLLARYRNGELETNTVFAHFPATSRSMALTRSGLLWIGRNGFAFAFRPAEADIHNLVGVDGIRFRQLDYLLPSQDGGLWVLADGHVQKWREGRLERDLGAYPWGGTLVTTACEDNAGNLIVGTWDNGVFWFNEDGHATHLSAAEDNSDNTGLSHNGILSLFLDREGDLWVGTNGGGLNRVRRRIFQPVVGARNWVTKSVAQDANGGFWIGYTDGGVSYWKDGQLRDYRQDQGLGNLDVRAVFVDHDQRVWAGTFGGLYYLNGDHFQLPNPIGVVQAPVAAIHQDDDGRLWFGTDYGVFSSDQGRLSLLTTNDGLSMNVVHAVVDDPGGNVWIGTADGLNRLREGRITVFRSKPGELPNDDISALLADAEGALWIGTPGNGLVRYRDGQWTRYTTRDGLASDSIYYLIEDAEGFLWMGSPDGLMRAARDRLNAFAEGETNSIFCRLYGNADGLPTRECSSGSQPAACRAEDGSLWFPTTKGLVTVDPAEIKPNRNPPPVVIESVQIERRELITNKLSTTWPRSVTLTPGQNLLEIYYASLNLAAPDRAQFRYRLEEYDPGWIEDARGTRVARYTRLPPGEYTFHVIAANEDGVWNEEGASMAVVVLPPFWRTAWFITASTLLLLGAIIGSVHYISTQRLQRQLALMRQQEALEKERSRIARDLHDQLGANLIQVALLGELVETDKDIPEEVEEHAKQISHTARETTRALDEIVWAANPSNDTLEGLVNYLCKYAQDYLALAGLRYRLDVPKQLPSVMLQPELRHNVFLAAKEAVNNVVKHAQATEARLRVRLNNSQFMVEIEDNGRGPAGTNTEAARARSGLRNMRKRLEGIGGTFTIEPGAEGGSIVRLTAPLRKR